jgi:hypothetical protein
MPQEEVGEEGLYVEYEEFGDTVAATAVPRLGMLLALTKATLCACDASQASHTAASTLQPAHYNRHTATGRVEAGVGRQATHTQNPETHRL